MNVVATVAIVGLGSYLLRLVPLLAAERVRLPERIEAALRHAGMGALTALAVAAVLEILRWGH